MAALLSHGRGDDLTQAIAAALERIDRAGPEFGSRAQLRKDLAVWQDCELGKWMLVHGGWNAHWTRYCISYGLPDGPPESANPVEHFFLTRAPAVVATRERARVFAGLLSRLVVSGSRAMSVPCGLLDDLLELPHAEDAELLVGLDLDPSAISGAIDSATALGLTSRCALAVGDAWQPPTATVRLGGDDAYRQSVAGRIDVLTSNGLNIYVADDAKVVSLYRAFRSMLRPGGTLVVSALTTPEEWDLADLPREDGVRARGLMLINNVMWSNYRPTALTIGQLTAAGFTVDTVHPGTRGMFPTFVATAN